MLSLVLEIAYILHLLKKYKKNLYFNHKVGLGL